MASKKRDGAIAILTTVGRQRQAASIARTLVDEQMAACVNIVGPVRSVYRWQGAVHDDREFLLVIKTRADRYPVVERRIREIHPYELPELIAIGVNRGSKPYLDWLVESSAPARQMKK
ncbi:MAG TPA: divalent-cation tolerance protein CutA [Candidatus Binataceae bacterium]|nr:divalent-cation tolerance protein CutA [Candidatus Binataceae bacterium]